MYYQKQIGIYAYHYNILGELHVRRYPTLEDFFKRSTVFFIKNTIVNEIYQHKSAPIVGDYFSSYATVIYDELGNLYDRDRLVGLCRKWDANKPDFSCRWTRRYDCGKKRGAHGHHRSIKTFQEKKQWFNVDEYNIRGRSKRSKSMLADVWDDFYSHNEKSWKTQSKRKNQYK